MNVIMRTVGQVCVSTTFILFSFVGNTDALAQGNSLCNPLASQGTAQEPPVYLMADRASGIYRLAMLPSQNGIGETLQREEVSSAEIAKLCADGIDLRAISNAPMTGAGTNGLQSPLPSTFSIIRRYGAIYGNFWIAGTRPANVTTQWVTFTFLSTAFDGTLEHAAIALFLDASALSGSNPQIVGNGMIIGDTHLRSTNDGGCGSPSWPSAPIYDAQVEAYWSGDNWIYGGTCDSHGVYDGSSYDFALQASTGSWVSYTASGSSGSYSSPAIYTLNQRPSFDPNQGGILFISTNTHPTGPAFNLRFTNASTGWF